MSSQTFLPWLSEHAFSIFIVVVLVVIAYIVYTLAFHRRLFPFLLQRRVSTVLHQPPSGSRPAATVQNESNVDPTAAEKKEP
jgi:hypothetical protein